MKSDGDWLLEMQFNFKLELNWYCTQIDWFQVYWL